MALTIKDIAELAGVSRGTVDRVINNRGEVSEESKERVLKVIGENGFVPSIAGKILATKRNPITLGVIIPSIKNEFFIDVIVGINKAASELRDFGVCVVIKEIEGYNTEAQIKMLDKLKSVNGLVIAPTNDEKLSKGLLALEIPIVAINTDIENSGRICYIGHEFKKGGKTAAGLMNLFTRGQKTNVGIVTGFTTVSGHNNRISGFCETIKEKYSNISISDIIETYDNNETAYAEVKKMLLNHTEIDALYITAGGVWGACTSVREFSGRIKTIITYDDIESTKKLVLDGIISATLCQEPQKQGYQSIRVLFDYLIGNKIPESEYLYTDVIIKIKENIEG